MIAYSLRDSVVATMRSHDAHFLTARGIGSAPRYYWKCKGGAVGRHLAINTFLRFP